MRAMPRGAALLLCCPLTIVGCLPRTNYNLATRHQELSITSTEKEVEMGRKLAQRVQKELKFTLDEEMQERVRSIGQRLAAVCDRKELLYSFAVVKDDEVNAFSLPGGYVFVNEGLVKKTANDDELASVLAHEIAHVAARHSMKRYESAIGMQMLQLAAMAAARGQQGAGGIGVAARATQLAYARQDELDADRLGVRYMRAAGFDATATLSFLQKLRKIHQDKLVYLPRGMVRPNYAMTHPVVPERLRAVKEELFGVADYVDYLNSPN